jgi:hypothetical protein
LSFAVVNSRVRGDEGIGVKLEGRRGEGVGGGGKEPEGGNKRVKVEVSVRS